MTNQNRALVRFKNRKSNLTIDTTLGLPLDETSYLSIPDGYNGNSFTSTDTASTAKLKDMLAMTRFLLSSYPTVLNLKLVGRRWIEVWMIIAFVSTKLDPGLKLLRWSFFPQCTWENFSSLTDLGFNSHYLSFVKIDFL